MRHFMMAAGATLADTAKTTMGDIQLPTTAKRVVAVWGHAGGGAGNTTLENVSGKLEIESNSLNIKPCEIPLKVVHITGTGMVQYDPKLWPVNWAGVGGAKLTGFISLELAQTINGLGNWGLIYED